VHVFHFCGADYRHQKMHHIDERDFLENNKEKGKLRKDPQTIMFDRESFCEEKY